MDIMNDVYNVSSLIKRRIKNPEKNLRWSFLVKIS